MVKTLQNMRYFMDLLEKNILVEDIPGAKRPSYSIVDIQRLVQKLKK